MTTRTLTLLMLSLFALAATAALQPLAFRLNIESRWSLVGLGVLCMTLTLFAGRRYLLPRGMAESSGRALAVTLALVVGSLTVAALVAAIARMLIGTTLSSVTSVGVLWVIALCLAFGRVSRASQRARETIWLP
jgi:hypothetical protein